MTYSSFDLSIANSPASTDNFGRNVDHELLASINGKDGEAFLNSALGNPLTNTGNYCRRFLTQPGKAIQSGIGETRAFINTPTGLVQPSAVTAMSARAWVRLGTPTGDVGSNWRAWTGLSLFRPSVSTSDFGGGWELTLEASTSAEDGSQQAKLALRGGPSAAHADVTANASGFNFLQYAESGLAFNTWYLIRLDIIPNAATTKTIKAYRSVDGGSSWNTLATHISHDGDADWQDTGRCGFTTGVARTSESFATIQIAKYIDRFRVGFETVS
jgi:hypothetical protein